MKILFTGGQTGGHFYPIIAVIEAIKDYTRENKMLEPNFYFMAPDPYNKKVLFDQQIRYIPVPAGKMRKYFSVMNFFDLFKTGFGIIKAVWKIFWIYPDVIFGKGGYGSFPALFAARILGIPVIIHESDTAPGRVNMWASKFARRIAISYPDAAEYFDKGKVAWTGNPVRKEIAHIAKEGAAEFLDLSPDLKTIFILGGSQGAQIINDVIIDSLPRLIQNYQIIHQTGKNNYKEVKETTDMILKDSPHYHRYKQFEYLDDLAMRMSAGAADLIISRAGSTIFEIAMWQIPTILIPITVSNNNHQRKNAYNYARSGAAIVVEEANLSDDLLISEIDRILNNSTIQEKMKAGAEIFSKPEAAKTIATEIMKILLEKEN
jgi:UDP-N-acetylglucosamine--N-acetylmuramyl-(pentapeptide) pyrophosphoryl-undecaprenol N-acetylglucosamine transferase